MGNWREDNSIDAQVNYEIGSHIGRLEQFDIQILPPPPEGGREPVIILTLHSMPKNTEDPLHIHRCLFGVSVVDIIVEKLQEAVQISKQ